MISNLYKDGTRILTFEETYNNYLKYLKESPYLTGLDFGSYLDNVQINRENAQTLLKDNKHKKIDQITIGDINYDLFLYEDDKKYLYIIDIRYPEIAGYIFYKEIANNGVVELGIWNMRKNIGLIRHIYVNWLLKKYNYIMSDAFHSSQAKRMWETLYNTYKNNYNFYVYNILNKNKYILKNIDEFEKYYDNMHNFRIIMERI
jgi:hypothetical protein